MNKSNKTFDELKRALVEATLKTSAPRIDVNFDQMKLRLSEDGQRYENQSRARSFTTDALMRSYNL